jgi:hypothetical protein
MPTKLAIDEIQGSARDWLGEVPAASKAFLGRRELSATVIFVCGRLLSLDLPLCLRFRLAGL